MYTLTFDVVRSRRFVLAAGFVVAAGLIVGHSGFQGAAMADDKPKEEIQFTKAEVRLILGPAGAVENKTVTLEKADRIAILMKFFPHVGEGKKSDTAGAWKAKVIIILTDKGGNNAKVTTNYSEWSEGFGDWPVKEKGLEEFIAGLFKKD
jgi:hypothetical protein